MISSNRVGSRSLKTTQPLYLDATDISIEPPLNNSAIEVLRDLTSRPPPVSPNHEIRDRTELCLSNLNRYCKILTVENDLINGKLVRYDIFRSILTLRDVNIRFFVSGHIEEHRIYEIVCKHIADMVFKDYGQSFHALQASKFARDRNDQGSNLFGNRKTAQNENTGHAKPVLAIPITSNNFIGTESYSPFNSSFHMLTPESTDITISPFDDIINFDPLPPANHSNLRSLSERTNSASFKIDSFLYSPSIIRDNRRGRRIINNNTSKMSVYQTHDSTMFDSDGLRVFCRHDYKEYFNVIQLKAINDHPAADRAKMSPPQPFYMMPGYNKAYPHQAELMHRRNRMLKQARGHRID